MLTQLLRAAVAAGLLVGAGPVAAVADDETHDHHHIMVDGFIIHGPYARSSGPNARAGAIFMGIENQSGQDDRLIDVESDVAAVTQLHTHEIGADGVAHMRHVPEGFPVPDGEILWLERGGRHVMLMGLKEPLAEGDTVHLVLRFEKAGEVALDVPVDGDAAPMAHGHMHGDHAAGGHDHGHGHGNAPGADQ